MVNFAASQNVPAIRFPVLPAFLSLALVTDFTEFEDFDSRESIRRSTTFPIGFLTIESKRERHHGNWF